MTAAAGVFNWNMLTAARTLYQEARGEPLPGQQAVAHAQVNRLKDGRWGDNLASVCLWHAAFSGWFSPREVNGKPFHDPNFAAACALADDNPELVALAAILQAAVDGQIDPTGGATHYHAKALPPPPWAKPPAIFCGQFGTQLFYKNVR